MTLCPCHFIMGPLIPSRRVLAVTPLYELVNLSMAYLCCLLSKRFTHSPSFKFLMYFSRASIPVLFVTLVGLKSWRSRHYLMSPFNTKFPVPSDLRKSSVSSSGSISNRLVFCISCIFLAAIIKKIPCIYIFMSYALEI